MFDPEAYRLDEPDLDAIFADSIAPTLFAGGGSSSPPLLVLIGAQPGAGKTRLSAAIRQRSAEPILEISGDELRAFHPRYHELLRLHPSAMPDGTTQASGAWVERSIDYAIDHQISVLVEGTFRRPHVPRDTAQRFHRNGFRVQVNLLAVSPEISRLSIAERFVVDAQSGGARFTSVEAHDTALFALPATLRALHDNPSPVNQFLVRDRSSGALYNSERPRSVTGSGLSAMLEIATREWWRRPLGIADLADWCERAERVTTYLRRHHRVDDHVQRLLAQLDLDRQFLLLASTSAHYDRVQRGVLLPDGNVIEPHLRSDPPHSG